MKKLTTALILSMLCSISAQAATYYHVYMKNGECTIEMRDPDTFKKQRGSDWEYLGKDSTRSGAEDIAEEAGCNM